MKARTLVLLSLLAVLSTSARARSATSPPANVPFQPINIDRDIPRPLPTHPGNIHLAGEPVSVVMPESLPASATQWRVLDDTQTVLNSGLLAPPGPNRKPLSLGSLGVGWYRIEFGTQKEPNQTFTTAAVIRRLRAPIPDNSPVCVDSATAWFARDDTKHQEELASLAALAGVNWVRDRLRWRDLQPQAGPLVPDQTTYDTAADIQYRAGLKVLQVFHDTPPWAREDPNSGGRFAPDLRHIHQFTQQLARRFKGRVQAWEPWNEGNVDTFGAHTVDQLCSWQKAASLGFKVGDPDLVVGWNATTTVPTAQHTKGVLANETWPYYDTYNIHSYDWAHSYPNLWPPAREATAGRPLWITEADRGTKHLKQPPFFDQDQRLEQLKAEWIAQCYATSLFAGATRHFHFVLGHYHEPSSVQFGLLRLDLTPRPAYVALATVGRCLAGARILGRWQPLPNLHVYAFRAKPDGKERDVLVIWAEKDVDWPARGKTTVSWELPSELNILQVTDFLGRSRHQQVPSPITSAPSFVFLPTGQAETLPLEQPPTPPAFRENTASPVVLQLSQPRSQIKRVEDLPWSQAYAYEAHHDVPLDLKLHIYNFSNTDTRGSLQVESMPKDWDLALEDPVFALAAGERRACLGHLRISADTQEHDGWITVRADCGPLDQPVVAFRVQATSRLD